MHLLCIPRSTRGGAGPARWALIAFALSPLFMRYGSAFMPDVVIVAAFLAGSVTVFAGSLRDNGVPDNWQEPVVFYRADRWGWSLAADQLDPARVAADQQAGARFFVDVDPALVPAGSPLAGWLAANATPLRTSATDDCGIGALRR